MPATTLEPAALDGLPRRGWVPGPAPITALPEHAAALGFASLHVQRDDQCSPMPGGSKVRKLDLLLAAPPWSDAPRWTSAGGIGSGHLVALVAAARFLGRHLEAHVFWEPLDETILGNLAYVASGPTTLRYHHGRVGLALSRPRLLTGHAVSAIGPGASEPLGVVGLVRAGLEVAAQVRAGTLPAPDVVFVPLGTGGTAAGLALGLGLGGQRCTVRAVAAVERPLAGPVRLKHLQDEARVALAEHRVNLPATEAAPIEVVRGALGLGYARPTAAALAACAEARALGLRLEPVYSGKAWAAMGAEAARWQGRHVLFWLTPHGRDLPRDPDWRDRLPPALARRLAATERRGPSRRQVVGGAVAVAALGAAAVRLGGYHRLPGFPGAVLAPWEAEVLAAAAEALIPDTPGGPWPRGPSPTAIAAGADAYLRGLPAPLARDIHTLIAVIEHGTGLDLRLPRFTRLGPRSRLACLQRLVALGGPLPQAVRGLRDLCLVGFWQDPSTWPAIGYAGPRLPPVRRDYAELVAPPGTLPRGALR